MQRVTAIKPKGDWPPPAADTVVLAYHDRRRRRIRMTAQGGTDFLLDLPRVATLHDGEGLVLEDGTVVEVAAADEPLLEIVCGDPVLLARVAWHLGNRHLPAEIAGGRILIADDHVIAEMARGLGATVTAVNAPFEPEGGAYDAEAGHGHRHAHGSGR